jgi:hypothetical protein
MGLSSRVLALRWSQACKQNKISNPEICKKKVDVTQDDIFSTILFKIVNYQNEPK